MDPEDLLLQSIRDRRRRELAADGCDLLHGPVPPRPRARGPRPPWIVDLSPTFEVDLRDGYVVAKDSGYEVPVHGPHGLSTDPGYWRDHLEPKRWVDAEEFELVADVVGRMANEGAA